MSFFPDQHQESNAAEFNTTKTSKSFTVVKMLMTLIHVTDTIACLPSRYIISVRTKYRPHNMDRFTCTTLGKSNRYSEDNSVCKHRVSTWRLFCDVTSFMWCSNSCHISWCYVICIKSREVLPNFGFEEKGRIDHIGVLQTSVYQFTVSSLLALYYSNITHVCDPYSAPS